MTIKTANAKSLNAPKKPRGRPPIKAQDSETRAALIQAGLAALTERGYASVTVDDILKSAALPKGAFYHHFQSKADFGMVLIDEYDRYFARRLSHAFAQDRLTPFARFTLFLNDAERGMARYGFRRGCLVGNLGQEMNALPDRFRARLIAIFEHWQALTAANFRDAQAQGEIAPAHDCAALAEWFWTGWEGAVLRAKLAQSPAPLRHYQSQFIAFATSS